MPSHLFSDEGVDLSETARLVAVLGGPRFPFGQLSVDPLSALAGAFERHLGEVFGPGGTVEPLFGRLAVAALREAPVATESCKGFLGGLAFLTGSGEVGHRPLLVFLERRQGIEGCSGCLVDDGRQPAPFGPELFDGTRGRGPS